MARPRYISPYSSPVVYEAADMPLFTALRSRNSTPALWQAVKNTELGLLLLITVAFFDILWGEYAKYLPLAI